MKKLIVGQKWKNYLASRSSYQMKAMARFARHRRVRAAHAFKHKRPKHFRKEVPVVAPLEFSIIHNPEGFVAFAKEMRAAAKSNNIYVDLSEVKSMTSDAIAGLLATNQRCRVSGTLIRGNSPKEAEAKDMLANSGFREYVGGSISRQVSVPTGRIKKFQRRRETVQNRFDQRVALELVEFATLQLTGVVRPHGPSYSLFSEAMLNTWNHASGGGLYEPPEAWWASIYYDSARKRACFTFLDQGIGIFKSHTLTRTLKVMSLFGLLNEAEILERLFRGQIPSSTREPGRGNGIPWMYETCKAGRIKNLTIIANRAFGDAERDIYRVLSSDLQGTLIYWEIE